MIKGNRIHNQDSNSEGKANYSTEETSASEYGVSENSVRQIAWQSRKKSMRTNARSLASRNHALKRFLGSMSGSDDIEFIERRRSSIRRCASFLHSVRQNSLSKISAQKRSIRIKKRYAAMDKRTIGSRLSQLPFLMERKSNVPAPETAHQLRHKRNHYPVKYRADCVAIPTTVFSSVPNMAEMPTSSNSHSENESNPSHIQPKLLH